jgi:hypothetical protein
MSVTPACARAIVEIAAQPTKIAIMATIMIAFMLTLGLWRIRSAAIIGITP